MHVEARSSQQSALTFRWMATGERLTTHSGSPFVGAARPLSVSSVLPTVRAATGGGDRVYVALGVLSTASDKYRRREKIRSVSQAFANAALGTFALRFVVGAPSPVPQVVVEEAALARDIVLLNMSETPFRCGIKYILWASYALASFPRAQWIAAGDDDAFVQMEHFEADLRRVATQTAGAPVLWGLIMWRAYYNNVTMDTSTGFTVRNGHRIASPLRGSRAKSLHTGMAKRRHDGCQHPTESRCVPAAAIEGGSLAAARRITASLAPWSSLVLCAYAAPRRHICFATS